MKTTDSITVLKALADPTRLDIVRALVRDHNDKASCSEVRGSSTLSQPTFSHHCTKLVEAGVLIESKQGTERIYELNSLALARIGIDPKKL